MRTIIFLLFWAGLTFAEPPPQIRLPEFPSVPTPIPSPSQETSAKLRLGQWYIVDFVRPLVVDAVSLGGTVSVTQRKGPLTLPIEVAIGRTPDADDPEMVTIPGPFVYVVRAKATGMVSLTIIPALNALNDAKEQIPLTRADLIRRMVDCEISPRPPPVPPPDPTPGPDGLLGLQRASREGVSKVTVADKSSQASKLAAAQRSIKSALAAGAYNSQAQSGQQALAAALLADRRAANNAAVKAADWMAWSQVVDPQLSSVYQMGRLKTTSDWQAALEEIALGLEGR